MEKEILVMLKNNKTFICLYHDSLVPSIGDTILIKEDQYYRVIERNITPSWNRVVVLVSEVE